MFNWREQNGLCFVWWWVVTYQHGPVYLTTFETNKYWMAVLIWVIVMADGITVTELRCHMTSSSAARCQIWEGTLWSLFKVHTKFVFYWIVFRKVPTRTKMWTFYSDGKENNNNNVDHGELKEWKKWWQIYSTLKRNH